jgi:hypothetical protein
MPKARLRGEKSLAFDRRMVVLVPDGRKGFASALEEVE